MTPIDTHSALNSPWYKRVATHKPDWEDMTGKLKSGSARAFGFYPPLEGLTVVGPEDNALVIFYLTGRGLYAKGRSIYNDLLAVARHLDLQKIRTACLTLSRVRFFQRYTDLVPVGHDGRYYIMESSDGQG